MGLKTAHVLKLQSPRCGNVAGVSPCTAFRTHTGTAQAGAARSVTLAASASSIDDVYNRQTARIVSGTGAGQERRIGDYTGATRVATLAAAEADFSPAPDATSVVHVIDRPNACYNTRRTCRDPANFALSSHTYSFTGRDDELQPGVLARPYLTRFEFSPTQLDFEEGLGRRADTRFTSIDETDSDIEQDPYHLDRAAPAQGTFWRRYKARNLHYAGHPASLETYQIVDGVWSAPTVEHFLIDAIEGPKKDGAVEIILKDPTSSLDVTKTPAPTTGKLAQALGLNDLQAVLETGEGAQYGTSGYFAHNGEVIKFTGRTGDTLTWPDGTHRGQFDTAAQAGKVGDALQLCHVGLNESFAVTLERLFNAGGMADSQLDLAGLAAEQTAWLRGYDSLTYCIPAPETTSTLVKELLTQAGMSSCWSSELQKQIFKVYAPQSPAAIVPKVLTGAGHLMLDSVQVESLDDKRLTRVTVRFGLVSATANLREAKNYATGERTVMVDAEGPHQYADVREKEIFSRWFRIANTSAMRTLSRRTASRYVDAPEDIEFFVHPKDQDVKEGDVVDLLTARYVDAAGAPKLTRVFVTRKHRRRRHGEYRGRLTNFGDRRYGFIAPNGTPDYPDNAGYCAIAAASGLMSDGTDGYRIW